MTTANVHRYAPGVQRHLAIALSFLTLACAGTGAVDSGTDAGLDAGRDAGLDSGSDAGPPGPRVCMPCRMDSQCGPGWLCVGLSDGSSGCAPLCDGDGDCDVNETCAEPEPDLGPVCLPRSGTCSGAPAGTSCASDDDCAGTFDRCVPGLTAAGSVCTTRCASDADCPFMASHCRALPSGSYCAPERPTSAELCRALVATGRAQTCDAGACPSGTTCHGSGALRLCLAPPSAGACPQGTLLRPYPGTPGVCVPTFDARDLVASCECVLSEPGSMLDEALGLAGRDRCSVAFPYELYRPLYEANPWLAEIAHDPFRLSFTDQVHGDWLAVPSFALALGARFDGASSSMASVLREAALLDDLAVRDAAPPSTTDLAQALEDLVRSAGGDVDRANIDVQVGLLPAAIAPRLAPVIAALERALVARDEALALYPSSTLPQLWRLGPGLHLATRESVPSPTQAWVKGALRGDVGVVRMAEGAIGIARAIEGAGLAELRDLDGTLTLETPRGRVAIRGAGATTYEGPEWSQVLFVLDLGGDDVYRAPVGATSSVDNGVSVAIDLGGADRYGYVEVPVADDVGPAGHARLPSDGAGRVAPGAQNGPSSLSDAPRQGAGRLGIGMLIDLGSENDSYRSLRMSQGYGALGVGLLWDEGGDDTYEAEAGSQGAASAGVGVLVDRGGADRYVAYHQSQGFAYTRAVGVLYDASGTDEYFSHPSDVLYWSPQSPGASNSSFTQGAAFGRRADFGDRVFMSGGLAILRDRAGDDSYTTGIFGQATGYWFGAGFLLDAEGNDTYDGEWYVQAGDAHYAIAALVDEAGNDEHNLMSTRRNASVAGGHDFSVGWLVDLGGDDVRRAPNLALGVGHAGGLGALLDVAGADTYDVASSLSLGNASIETPGDALRRLTGTVGLFLDAGGTDTYTRPTVAPVANDSAWTQEAHTGENEHGAGVDRDGVPHGVRLH